MQTAAVELQIEMHMQQKPAFVYYVVYHSAAAFYICEILVS